MFRFRRRKIQSRSNLAALQGLTLPKLRFLNNAFSERYIKPAEAENYEPVNNIIREFERSFEEYFALHITRYLGQTVTVFVKGGGYSGMGYTGILYNVNTSYVQLIIKLGPAPACSLGSTCPFGVTCNVTCDNSGGFYSSANSAVFSPGAVASIPLCKIASFVHNSV